MHTTIPESNAPETLADLRRQMASLYTLQDLPLPQLSIAGTGQPYIIALPSDPNAPLDQLAAQLEGGGNRGMPATVARVRGERVSRDAAGERARATVAAGIHMPYWGLPWASGQALAENVQANQEMFRGRRALELGCGLGLVAAAALAAGTEMLSVADCFPEALLFTKYNTLRLTGSMPETLLLDWRTSEGREACRAAGPFDLVLAADVLYEQEDVAPLLGLIPLLLAPGGTIHLAEPGRRVSRAFLAATQEQGWKTGQAHMYHRSWPPDDEVVEVTVHTLTPP